MSISYIIETIRPYLVTEIPRFEHITYSDSFSVDVADTKLDMLDEDGQTTEMKRKILKSKYKQSSHGVQTRTVQGEFRSALFTQTPHKCPICGFDFKNLLVATVLKRKTETEPSIPIRYVSVYYDVITFFRSPISSSPFAPCCISMLQCKDTQ